MIPDRIVTIYGLADAPEPFGLWHYLCLRSMFEVNRPVLGVDLLCETPPTGPWWNRAAKFVRLRPVDAPREIFGRELAHYAHRADVLRIQNLLAEGGVYMDLDTLCVAPFAEFLDAKAVMGVEAGIGLCNAVVMSEPGNLFLHEWLGEFASFTGNWNSHAVVAPWKVAQRPHMKDWIRVVAQHFFFTPYCDAAGLNAMHVLDKDFPGAISHHLWHTKAAKFLDAYTPEAVRAGKSTFARLARRFLPADCGTFQMPFKGSPLP
jgi:hypothetical protein